MTVNSKYSIYLRDFKFLRAYKNINFINLIIIMKQVRSDKWLLCFTSLYQ